VTMHMSKILPVANGRDGETVRLDSLSRAARPDPGPGGVPVDSDLLREKDKQRFKAERAHVSAFRSPRSRPTEMLKHLAGASPRRGRGGCEFTLQRPPAEIWLAERRVLAVRRDHRALDRLSA
jgi:hypothetical protein